MRPREWSRAFAMTAAGLCAGALAAASLIWGGIHGAAARDGELATTSTPPFAVAPEPALAASAPPVIATRESIAPAAAGEAAIQYGYGRRRRSPPRYPDPNTPQDGSFSFARVMYTSVRYEALGQGWYTDYPEGDKNYMSRLSEFTLARVRHTSTGYPDHVVLTLHDEELFKYPFIFMSDVGTVGFDEVEVARLHDYLLKGGFLWVDDFWGWSAWDQWTREIGRVLPPDEYPIVDIAVDHPIRQMLYPIEEFPQIPSIQWWRNNGRYYDNTSERGAESATPHLRGINDKDGRVMVLMSHNTDIADGWERENEDFQFFESFSFPAYAVGINVGLYSMSH